MPKFYWAEAVRTAVYIEDRIGDKVSAHELYFGRKQNLRHLRIFGSIAYMHVLVRSGGSWMLSRRSASESATLTSKRGISGITQLEDEETGTQEENPKLFRVSEPIKLLS